MNALQKFSLAVSLVMIMPLAAQANSLTHDVGGEAGLTFHPDHVASTLTRAAVRAEIEAARKDGTIGFTSTFTVPTPTAAGHPTTMNFVQTSMTSQVNQAATSATNAATSASGAATSATNASTSSRKAWMSQCFSGTSTTPAWSRDA